MPTCACLLERRESGHGLLKSTFNAKNYVHAGCQTVVLIYTSSHFGAIYSSNVCRGPKSLFTKPPYFKGGGSSRSFRIIDADRLKNSSPVLVMISSTSVFICNRFCASRASSGKIKFFLAGTSLSSPCLRTPFSRGL